MLFLIPFLHGCSGFEERDCGSDKCKRADNICRLYGAGLYHPGYGYYTSGKEKIGKRGDFYTSSDVHSVFGELIARQLEQMWRLLGSNRFTVVEIGAGKGWLCHDILKCVKNEYPELFEEN